MASFDQSIVSVSGHQTHQWDFTFYKNNGDIANRVRAELGSALKEISIDKDGDIDINTTDEGNFIVTPGAVIAAGWLTDSKNLLVPQEIRRFTRIIELLAKSKGALTTDFYSVRLFFRFRPGNSMSLLRERAFKNTLESILGEQTPSDIESLKFSTSYRKDGFVDFLELEGSPKDVQLRYSRSRKGADFDSYHAFLDAVDLAELLEKLKPFAEILMAAEPQLLGRRSLLSEMK
jgi:hypothetical protein